MPRSDPLPRSKRTRTEVASVIVAVHRRRRPGKSLDDGGVPVEPNRPNTLSGGAAAPLEFDE